MFRDQQVWHYADDVAMLGIVHRIARVYRRRVLNYELTRQKAAGKDPVTEENRLEILFN
jgi:hypothetical protein